MTASRARRVHLSVLLALFSILWVGLAIEPVSREAWLLENALVLLGVGVLVGTYRWLPLSRLSYTMIFLFLSLHVVGAHFTYSLVPYDMWFERLLGFSLNELMGWERNHFDRWVHFFYGLLLSYPIREVFLRIADVRGFWGYFLPLDLTLSTSAMYELIEWWAAMRFGGDLAMDYLGTQGDIWDAHKDMTLAALGATITMTVTALVNWRIQRDFAREWVESLRVKSAQPLGEEAIARMLHDEPPIK